MKTRLLVSFLILVLLAVSSVAIAQEPVPKIEVLSNAQAQDPIEFEYTRLLVENMRQLGLDVEHRGIPWEQQLQIVWFERDNWQMTAWRMVGRPERMDPDEFVFNLFHSSTAEAGYNFVGYINEEYDVLAETQRAETDKETRRDLIYQAQELIANDVPYVYAVHRSEPQLVRTDVFDVSTVVDQQGIGIKNFWTWVEMTPLGDQKAIITQTGDNLKSINPLYIAGDAPSRVTELIWDRLMRIGPDGLAEPWAAESVVWEDPTNLLITIREGMLWHDGNPVTVEDVKYSFEAPQTGEAPMYAPFVGRIANIEIVDDLTLRFTLSEPWVAFETASLAKLNIIPKHIWEPLLEELMQDETRNAENHQEETPIGSGPYRMVGFDVAEQAVLEANPDHWAVPKAEKWIMLVIPNMETVLGQIQTGEINFVSEFEGDAQILADVAEADPSIEMFASPELGFRFYAFNLRVPPFDDLALRQAVAHAVPKESILKNIFKGFGVPADSYVSVAIDYWHNPDLPQYEFDIEKAREVLADAGYTWDADGNLLMPTD